MDFDFRRFKNNLKYIFYQLFTCVKKKKKKKKKNYSRFRLFLFFPSLLKMGSKKASISRKTTVY